MFSNSGKNKTIAMFVDVCEAVADGDFEQRITDMPTNADLQLLAKAINRLIDRTDAYVRETTASLECVRDNEYYRRINQKGMTGAFGVAASIINEATQSMEDRVHAFGGVVDHFNETVSNVVVAVEDAARDLNTQAHKMSALSTDTSEKASQVSAVAEQTAGNVNTVASATEELNASISEISSQTHRSLQINNQAVEQSQLANQHIESLTKASNEITEFVQMITDIATKTNMLALNATIEAARAGDAGKGFAVVAGEVKNLASQTTKATEEIERKIASIQQVTLQASASIKDITGTIANLSDSSSSIAAAVEQQGAATGEISRSVAEAATGMEATKADIHVLSECALDADKSGEQVANSANDLPEHADVLRHALADFMTKVKEVV
ncbi:methyl-accepting chemotaxis protein [Terasakiella sp. A23]|uniref:methyl-accepting chemotaxis protein n=1 Tax=Terasakiella sp. FCG-A23 TaxID=3080561 RepID=UPI002954F47C|nr:methyl-accepting chemotaxis protein [Terasakiella sp. A23]MDV7339063.1 methyl-accepting chemotaxis protein [Terasakiella sp. A23]